MQYTARNRPRRITINQTMQSMHHNQLIGLCSITEESARTESVEDAACFHISELRSYKSCLINVLF
jgi:hypothetical protein